MSINKKILKYITACVMVMVCTWVAQAHEFWLQPQKFFFEVGERAAIGFKVGENFTGEPWDLKVHRVERLQALHLEQVKDLKGNVVPEGKSNIEVPLTEEGTHLVVMQSNNAFIELEADKFNAYLEEDGLMEIKSMRERSNSSNKPSKEFYSRHTKLLLQAGVKRDDTYRKVVGLPIEIIPLKNPYAMKRGETMRFRVLWQGKPLFGASVKVWNNHENRVMLQNIFTSQEGIIEAPLSNSGMWMISVVKMVPSKEKGADWQSYWGSLVFGAE
jgi:uncharacterized GH25 family protein